MDEKIDESVFYILYEIGLIKVKAGFMPCVWVET